MKAMLVSNGTFACESTKDLGLRDGFNGTIQSHRRIYLYQPEPADPVSTFYLPQFALSYCRRPQDDKEVIRLVKAWGAAGDFSLANRQAGFSVQVKLAQGDQETIELLIFPPDAEKFERYLQLRSDKDWFRTYYTTFRVVPRTCMGILLDYRLEFTAFRMLGTEHEPDAEERATIANNLQRWEQGLL